MRALGSRNIQHDRRCPIQINDAVLFVYDKYRIRNAFENGEISVLFSGHRPIAGLEFLDQFALICLCPFRAECDHHAVEHARDVLQAYRFIIRFESASLHKIQPGLFVIDHQRMKHLQTDAPFSVADCRIHDERAERIMPEIFSRREFEIRIPGLQSLDQSP